MTRLTIVLTPRGPKRLHYATGLLACAQIAQRNGWQLAVRHGQLRMEEAPACVKH